VIIFVVVLKDHIYNDLPQSIADLKNKILARTLWTTYFLGGGAGGDGGGGGGGEHTCILHVLI
jgi:hypothetical protein